MITLESGAQRGAGVGVAGIGAGTGEVDTAAADGSGVVVGAIGPGLECAGAWVGPSSGDGGAEKWFDPCAGGVVDTAGAGLDVAVRGAGSASGSPAVATVLPLSASAVSATPVASVLVSQNRLAASNRRIDLPPCVATRGRRR